MSHALTETPTKGSTVTVPDDGDGATAASIEAPLQALANRVKFCENAVDVSGGKQPLRVVAGEAAMTAIASPASGDQVVFPTVGLFTFVAGSTATPVAGVIVTHASGRWYRSDWEMLADVGGTPLIATLDSGTGKLPLARHTNGTYAVGETEFTGTWGLVATSSASASYVDTTLTHTISALEVGDVVEITAEIYLSSSLFSAAAWARLKTIEDLGGTPFAVSYSSTEAFRSDTSQVQFTLRKLVTVSRAGTFQAMIQIKGDGVEYSRIHYPSRINSRTVRP